MTQPRPDIEAVKAFNATITAAFRAKSGVVGGPFDGNELLLLTTVEREEIIPKLTAAVSAFAHYQANTKRVIPIFELQPVH